VFVLEILCFDKLLEIDLEFRKHQSLIYRGIDCHVVEMKTKIDPEIGCVYSCRLESV